MTLHEAQRRLKPFDIRREVAESIQATEDAYLVLNRKQLRRGRDKNDNYLSPKYSEDPYFKSKEAALRYANWKKSIDVQTDKPFDVPNLYINGRFHNSLHLVANTRVIDFISASPDAKGIEQKFNQNKIYGLTDESKAKYIPENLFPELKQRITSKLGFGFK